MESEKQFLPLHSQRKRAAGKAAGQAVVAEDFSETESLKIFFLPFACSLKKAAYLCNPIQQEGGRKQRS
ncbi:hypothetical protein [Botryobacter ruber]|uniref:hypothetical protein n=1 Tax=Botryobacter ruber TaxID=2171629 RepID=UPI000F64C5E0|nr:hypothetical protein [Botryobacter ruber]